MVAKWEVEADFGGPVRTLIPRGIRTPQPRPKGAATGWAVGVGVRGPFAKRRGHRARTGPQKPASTPHFATTHFALLPEMPDQPFLVCY